MSLGAFLNRLAGLGETVITARGGYRDGRFIDAQPLPDNGTWRYAVNGETPEAFYWDGRAWSAEFARNNQRWLNTRDAKPIVFIEAGAPLVSSTFNPSPMDYPDVVIKTPMDMTPVPAALPIPEISDVKGPATSQETPIKTVPVIPPPANGAQNLAPPLADGPISAGYDWSWLFAPPEPVAPAEDIYYAEGDGGAIPDNATSKDPVLQAEMLSPQKIATYAAIALGLFYMLKDMKKTVRKKRVRR